MHNGRRAHVPRSRRRTARFLAVFAMVPAFALFLATSASADVTSVDGSAYGESVNVTTLLGVSVTSGPLPSVTLPGTGGGPISQTVLNANVAGLLSTGVLTATTQGSTGATGGARSSSDVANVGLGLALTPFLTIGAVHSDCQTSTSGSYGGTTLVGASLNGAGLAVNPAPNTTITIPLVGSVTLNEQIINQQPGSSSITVNAIHVHLAGPLGNGDIIVGQSQCSGVGPTITVPTGAVGGVLLTGLVAVLFVVYQFRRNRANRSSSV